MINKTRGDLLYLVAGVLVGKLLPGSLDEWRSHIEDPEKRQWLSSGAWICIVILAVLWVISKEG